MGSCTHDRFTRVEEFSVSHVAACIRCGHRIYGLEALDTLAKQAEADMEPVKRDQDMRSPALLDDAEWLEFQLLATFHNLRQVKPDHYLVRVVSAALRYRPSQIDESPPALLRRQAE